MPLRHYGHRRRPLATRCEACFGSSSQ